MTLYETAAERRLLPAMAAAPAAVLAGVLLLVVSAKIAVPFYPVPVTLQTLAVIGIGLTFGPSRGLAAVMLYLGMGAAGLPVFAGTPERGIGIAYILGPTGGYLAGYAHAVVTAGALATRGWDRHPATAFAAALIAGAVIYLPGLLWLGAVIGFDKPVLTIGLYPFIVGDIVKAGLAALAFSAAWRWLTSKGVL